MRSLVPVPALLFVPVSTNALIVCNKRQTAKVTSGRLSNLLRNFDTTDAADNKTAQRMHKLPVVVAAVKQHHQPSQVSAAEVSRDCYKVIEQ